MAISFRAAWQSLVYGADAPPSTWQEDGIAPGRLPNLLLNWLLVGITEVVDDYLGDLSKKYEHLRWISDGHVVTDGVTWEESRGVGGVLKGVPRQLTNQAAEDNGFVIYYLDTLPRSCRITDIKAILKPTTGHTGLPTTMPKMRIVVYQRSDLAEVRNIVEDDPSADVTAYQLLHTINSPGDIADLLEGYDPAEYRFAVQVFGEAGSAGTTFIAGLQIYGLDVKYHLELNAMIESATEVP